MPITTRTWSRVHGSTAAFSPGVWNNTHVSAVSPIDGPPATLLRTLCMVHLKVVVDAGADLPPDWWVFSDVRVGLKFSADATTPGFATDDDSPDVIALQQLRPSFLAGSLEIPSTTALVWAQTAEIDVKTERKGAPNPFSGVFAFIWATDTYSVFHGTGSYYHVESELQLATLWGQ